MCLFAGVPLRMRACEMAVHDDIDHRFTSREIEQKLGKGSKRGTPTTAVYLYNVYNNAPSLSESGSELCSEPSLKLGYLSGSRELESERASASARGGEGARLSNGGEGRQEGLYD